MIGRRLATSPPPADRLTRYRHNRNFVAVGDIVHVRRGPGRRPFDGPVRDIRSILPVAPDAADAGDVKWLAVLNPLTGNERIVAPTDIVRRAQSMQESR